jgi:hypothetical protein
LREFDLQCPFRRPRPSREDIEDQLRPVDHLDPRRVFQVALLRRRQVMVDDQHVGLDRLRQFFQFLDLAESEQRRRVDCGPHLKNFRSDLRPRAGR